MSTPTTPGIFAAPASGKYPNLTGLGLPKPLTDAVRDAYTLLYSLRDALSQQSQTVTRTIQYGTHLQRAQVNPQAVPDGSLFFETDDGDAYQSRLASQQTTREWVELAFAGAAGPPGPAGPAGPVNPQTFLYNPGLAIGATYQNNFGLPLWVKMLLSYPLNTNAGIAAQIGPSPPPTQVVGTSYVPAIAAGGIQVETFFIVPVNWFYILSASPGYSISATCMWY